jgi:hypothetical protein
MTLNIQFSIPYLTFEFLKDQVTFTYISFKLRVSFISSLFLLNYLILCGFVNFSELQFPVLIGCFED